MSRFLSPACSPASFIEQGNEKKRRKALLETLQGKVRRLQPGPLVVAVSGGLDSVTLLHLLCHTAEPRKNPLYPCYIYHGIRKEHPEAEALPKYCETLGLTLRCFRIQDGWLTQQAAQRGMSLEDLARTHRYQRLKHYLGRLSASAWPGCLVLAHHADDQAENLLMGLQRGAGLAALAGMREWQNTASSQKTAQMQKIRHIQIWRPLLDWEQRDLQHWAQIHNLPHWEDCSNFEPNAMRNFYRWQVLPQIKRLMPGLVHGLRRTQRQLMMHEDALEVQRSELRAGLVPAQKNRTRSIVWNGALHQLPYPAQIELIFLLFDELYRKERRQNYLARNRSHNNRLPMDFCIELLRQSQNHRDHKKKGYFQMRAHGYLWQIERNRICASFECP